MFFGDFKFIVLYIFLPVLIILFIMSRRKVHKVLSIFTKNLNFQNDKNYKRISNLRIFSIIFMILASASLVFALMQPKWGIIEQKIKTDNYMVTIALDLSRSMDADDVWPSRLERVKLEIEKFVKKTDNLSVALVGFAGTSFIASPFTQDMETFTYILDNLTTKSVTLQGTRIADALVTAKNTFNVDAVSKKSIILITDGEDHGGYFDDILKQLNEMNVSVYTVGVGTEVGATISTDLGVREKSVVSKRDDNTLKLIADSTHGKSYIAENVSLESIFDDMKQSMDSVSAVRNNRSYKERFQIFLAISAGLIFLASIFNILTQIKVRETIKEKIIKEKIMNRKSEVRNY
ncbi:membrane protein containing von Willebrand factor (vWA) type A domain protein [Brachyspira hyodysenteriae]|uniref:vWA domain-containing protein n=1 Tax=Brachyspira hyodysenteriae TaxID=159 RepID=UPI00063DB52A|nr:VWA domain-containing protein [Brachyspira hyodysenteriae]KLI41298.1 membrane protein containing von Willebrand factor (vWA) type A domain protein [Brachyspira hyodysenteriae]